MDCRRLTHRRLLRIDFPRAPLRLLAMHHLAELSTADMCPWTLTVATMA